MEYLLINSLNVHIKNSTLDFRFSIVIIIVAKCYLIFLVTLDLNLRVIAQSLFHTYDNCQYIIIYFVTPK